MAARRVRLIVMKCPIVETDVPLPGRRTLAATQAARPPEVGRTLQHYMLQYNITLASSVLSASLHGSLSVGGRPVPVSR